MNTVLKNILPLAIASIFLFMMGCIGPEEDSKKFKINEMEIKVSVERYVGHEFDSSGAADDMRTLRISFGLFESGTGKLLSWDDDIFIITINGQEYTIDYDRHHLRFVNRSPFASDVVVDFINDDQLDFTVVYKKANKISTTFNVSVPPTMYMTQGIVYRESFLWESEDLYFEWFQPVISDAFGMVNYDIGANYSAECLVIEPPTFDKTMTSITIPAGSFTVANNTNCVSGFVSSEPAYITLNGRWEFEPQIQSDFAKVLIEQERFMKVDIGKISIP